jgi:integrase
MTDVASGSVKRYDGKQGTTWRIVFRETPGGKQRMETVDAATREDAERLLQRRLIEVEDGTYSAPTGLTFREFGARFITDHAEPRLRRKTITDYRAMLKNHLYPELGDLRLEQVTPVVIDRYIARKRKAKKPLSPKTLNNHLRLLHTMMERAVRWRLLKVNPAASVDKLKVEQDDTATLEPAEVRAIMAEASPTLSLFVLAAVLTGGRLNEVLSLTWDRIDFDKATLTLDRQWTADGWAPLKSRKRVHALPAELWQGLPSTTPQALTMRLRTSCSPLVPAGRSTGATCSAGSKTQPLRRRSPGASGSTSCATPPAREPPNTACPPSRSPPYSATPRPARASGTSISPAGRTRNEPRNSPSACLARRRGGCERAAASDRF